MNILSKKLPFVAFALFLTTAFFASDALAGKFKKTVFAVSGNCGMCEMRIEGALSEVKGVKLADWDKTTKKITVKYDPSVITLASIQQKIADVGYDNAGAKAKDEVYAKLPGCCKYERAGAKASGCCSKEKKASCSKDEASCAKKAEGKACCKKKN
ncbi:hypothetical protein FUAX_03360 [Fulvitalea axinellae]|uniref:HMA domain-containing protein n=1 Tax=Fulvitalea axinellae TaxID=1182444 RepID=A0AAU9C7B5_9BACT|nr:hypothetical protein FUAX_03360 [Fulvitalea axinellae]